jgi:peroxiredoxin
MKSPFLFILIGSVILFNSCKRTDGYKITAELTGFPDSTIFYLNSSTTEENFDSAILVHGKALFEDKMEDPPDLIRLTAIVNNEHKYCNLFIGNDIVKVEGDIKDFPWNVKITGSKTQDELDQLQNSIKSNEMKRDSMAQAFFSLSPQLQEETGKVVWDSINKLDSITYLVRVQFIKSHINSYAGILNLTWFMNTLPKDTIRTLFNELTPEFKSSRYAKKVQVYLKEKISEIGDQYHDFEATNKDGQPIKFSSFTGKYLLLDFTSANCGPCVRSAEELRMIHKTYNDSLVIISFSIDPKKETWLKSLERDSVTWTSLWDGQGTFSETYIKYGINGVPAFFLIDPKGKIVDKWMGYGKGSLEEKLGRFNKFSK